MKAEDIEYEIARETVFNLQVCTGISPKDEESLKLLSEKVNAEHPCGTSAGWVLTTREDAQPVRCNDYVGKYHYLFDA